MCAAIIVFGRLQVACPRPEKFISDKHRCLEITPSHRLRYFKDVENNDAAYMLHTYIPVTALSFLAVSCLPQAGDQDLLAKFSAAVYERMAIFLRLGEGCGVQDEPTSVQVSWFHADAANCCLH